MPTHSKGKPSNVSLETCNRILKDLEEVSKVDDLLQKVDLLIEHLFLAKADLGCFFDHQIFIDASKDICCDITALGDQQYDGKILRQLCISFIRTLATLIRKESYKVHLISRVLKVIRLEISLLTIATKEAKDNSSISITFPVFILEFLIGTILYAEEYDDEFVDSLLSEHLLISPEWVYYSFIALERIKKNFDSSQQSVYKDYGLTGKTFFGRFVSLLLKMPQPQSPRQRIRVTVAKKESHVKLDDTNGGDDDDDDVDSDSSIEYSDESVEEYRDDSSEGDIESGDEIETMDEHTQNPYNYMSVYSALWQGTIFGRLSLPNELMQKVLNHMPTRILPYATNPAVYANWLIRNLNGDDSISSMLSLNSVFELILKYGLGEVEGINPNKCEEQPISAFYERLYEHLNDDVIGSSYGSEFLGLLNTALKSTMLPSQLIAKFIKKLVRTACFTRCLDSTTLLTIAVNMLKRHNHTCLSMVHGEKLRDEEGKQDVFNMHKRTYDGGYNDYNKEGQVEEVKDICLWELPLLMNHFSERTARIASTFYSDLKKKRCILLKAEDIIGCDAREHLRQELARARREDVNTFRKALQKTTTLTTQIL